MCNSDVSIQYIRKSDRTDGSFLRAQPGAGVLQTGEEKKIYIKTVEPVCRELWFQHEN